MSVFKTYLAAFLIVGGSFGVGVALWNYGSLTQVDAALVVAVFLLGIGQFVFYLNRDRTQERTVAQVNDLSMASAQAVQSIKTLEHDVSELKREQAKRENGRDDDLKQQFEVLETLVKQLADEVSQSRSTQAAAAAPVQPAPGELRAPAAINGGAANANGSDAKPEHRNGQLEARVRGSLEDNRVDLYLQPVVTLPQRKTCYYEALTRLRDAAGETIMPSSYLEVAENAGIMPMIDNLLLFRCVKVVRRLVERNRNIGVFCNISARSLLDAEFFPQFLEFMQQNQELSGALVFEFSQETVQNAGPLELESLALLKEMGFRFSMDHVNTLDIDFQSLADRGFAFLRVDAATLIDGMKSAGARIHSADLKALLRRYGIELIAEKVETENQVVTLLDYQIAMGQGYLFSEPRLVREEVIETDGAAERRAG